MIICFDFLRNKNYVNKVSFRNSILHKVLIKIYLQSFVLLYCLFGFIFKIIFTISTSHWTTGPSVKPSISGSTLFENASWVPSILSCSLTYCFSFFSVIAIFKVNSCIFLLKGFSCSNSYHFPFCLVIMLGTIKLNGNCKAMNSHHEIKSFRTAMWQVYFYTIKSI